MSAAVQLQTVGSATAAALYDAIGSAGRAAELDDLAKCLWRDWANGKIDEADATRLAEYIEQRRPGRTPPRPVAEQSGGRVSIAEPNLRPVGSKIRFRFPRRLEQRSPDRQASYERRHRLAYSGVIPHYLAPRLTIGGMALLRVVADEHIVSQEQAFQNDTAHACGSLIARSIASMPARVLVPRGASEGDGNERLVNHPVELLFCREANPELAAFQFTEMALLSTIFEGIFFAETERDQLGRPLALWPLRAERMDVYHDPQSLALQYYYRNSTQGVVTLDPHDVFHLAGPRIYGALGMSVISYARQSLGVAIAQERFAGNFARNQAAPSGLFKVSSAISEDGFKRFKAAAESLYKGWRNAGRPLFADGDWDFKPITINPADAQFLDQRKFSVETICRWFGVPPQLVGVQEKQTLNNFEQAMQQFVTYTIGPWVRRIEQEANRKLLDRSAAGRRPFLQIDTHSLVKANTQAFYQSLAFGRQWGFLSANDCRTLLGLEPIGPEGDIYLQPLNMEPAEAS
jgi:HK97 family phage portal protein